MAPQIIATIATLIPFSTSAASERVEKLVVMPLRAPDIEPDVRATLDDVLVQSIRSLGHYEVLGYSDVNALLGLEKSKDALGCDDVACAVEIGGALESEHVVFGSMGRLGDRISASLTLIDTRRQVVTASARFNGEDKVAFYDRVIEEVVLRLFGLKEQPALQGATLPETATAP